MQFNRGNLKTLLLDRRENELRSCVRIFNDVGLGYLVASAEKTSRHEGIGS